ncbi:hypothetical protein Tco_1428179 [Tanacetum coccineum]
MALSQSIWKKFTGYETSEEELVEQPRRHDLHGFVDHLQLQQGNLMNGFAPPWLPQSKDNMNGWLLEDEDEVDSDLESTASSKPVWEKTTKDDHDCASQKGSKLRSEVLAAANKQRESRTLLSYRTANTRPSSTQVRYHAGAGPEIRGMLRATQPTTIQTAILRAGILTDEAVSCADFSFISTEFAPLLNVRPSIVNPGYVIEVDGGKKVEVDRIIRDCK